MGTVFTDGQWARLQSILVNSIDEFYGLLPAPSGLASKSQLDHHAFRHLGTNTCRQLGDDTFQRSAVVDGVLIPGNEVLYENVSILTTYSCSRNLRYGGQREQILMKSEVQCMRIT